jgi:enoyl-CoA hydratase/carnithine racemase
VGSDHLIVHNERGVVHVELARAECGNLITMEMVSAIADACRGVPKDARLFMISGRGADFCKGRDYGNAPEDAKGGKAPTALHIVDKMTAPIVDAYTLLKDLPVPSLAVVQGAAHGFGCALAASCDVVLAAKSSRFRLPEMLKGLPPTLAMSAMVDRVGSRALGYLVYSTAEINGDTAFGLGLASAVVPDEQLGQRAEEFAKGIRSQPVDAVRAVKEFLRRAPSMEPRGRADFGANIFAKVLSSR